ncbi:glycerophosphoryl diester phosphodiesterase [Acinetobacter marinus]|uniref:Glycerophosphoryl diester phosphodiesterase n=1 Tax=Acinetobacter marinus TaxID=281375 RepID=A0A1G6HKD0_9GAMM|nr:glycerophosphodiester phosphodiesterase [Acinetobacter marinus]SDB94712.1 glycerophosphoryl diester phosphodiesterase [Acinetobacter marinus]
MQIIGHRGARGEAPENTLGGFQYLRDLGVRAVEFDVRLSKQQELVIIHDDHFLRTTGVDLTLANASNADIQSLNLAHTMPDWHQPEALPLLSQVMQICHDFDHIEVEAKAVDTQDQADELVEYLETALANDAHHVTITSFDVKILTALQQRQSEFQRGFLVEFPFGAHAIETAVNFGCDRIGWKDILATQELIDLSHQAGLKTSVWTVNDVERAKTLRDFGIDGLITDLPKSMLEQL